MAGAPLCRIISVSLNERELRRSRRNRRETVDRETAIGRTLAWPRLHRAPIGAAVSIVGGSCVASAITDEGAARRSYLAIDQIA
jgi:hypothetical protein